MSMWLHFTKMHGLGNDFAVLDMISQQAYLSKERIQEMADRRFGIGFDQLLLVEPPMNPNADFRYRIFNADGSEVEHCGNGARCFARFVTDKKLINKQHIAVEIAKGMIYLTLDNDKNVTVDMGTPVLSPREIPTTFTTQAIRYPFAVGVDGIIQNLELCCISMGNPHGVMIVDDVESAPVETLGPLLEQHEHFPRKANIGFMEIVNRAHIKLRVYERGAGETLACGTGACAAAVAAKLLGLTDDTVTVTLPGGDLSIHWEGGDTNVLMTGPATTVFEGQFLLK